MWLRCRRWATPFSPFHLICFCPLPSPPHQLSSPVHLCLSLTRGLLHSPFLVSPLCPSHKSSPISYIDNFLCTPWTLQTDYQSFRVINCGSNIHTTELIKRTSAQIQMAQTFVQYLLSAEHCHNTFNLCETLFNHQINPSIIIETLLNTRTLRL